MPDHSHDAQVLARGAGTLLPASIGPAGPLILPPRELDSASAARHTLARGRRDQLRRRLLALGDVAALSMSLWVGLLLTSAGNVGEILVWFLALLPGWVLLLKAYGLYENDTKRISHVTVDDIPRLFHALLLGAVLVRLYFDLVGDRLGFATIVIFGTVALVAMVVARSLVRTLMRRALAPERVLVVGHGELSESLVRKIRSHPEYGLEPIGTVADADPQELKTLVEVDRVDRVILASSAPDTCGLIGLLSACRQVSLKVSIVPSIFEALGPATEVDDVEGVTVLGLNPPVLPRSSQLIKRLIDIACAGTFLALSAPLLVLIGLAIRLDSRGPVLFAQWRVGKGGRPFRIMKFRTMVDGAEGMREGLLSLSSDPNWVKLDHDPRITRVGGLLRKASLDELPQLWNVLTGTMSLVGPRPLPPSEDSLIEGWGRGRLDIKPGITGYWQVLGRTNIPFTEMVKLDYVYVTNWSLWTDIRLLLRTLPAVLTGRGVN
jgi:exopolysaccharide biosynthesis polyprenyl glycosylphosphotransferase